MNVRRYLESVNHEPRVPTWKPTGVSPWSLTFNLQNWTEILEASGRQPVVVP